MTFDPTAHRLAFVLPMSVKKGDITFTATRTGEDVRMPIPLTNCPRHVVSTEGLAKGIWRTLLYWSDGSIQYQQEAEIRVV